MEIVDSKRPHLIIENILHFYNEKILTDVVIVIGKKRIPGHKLVLATTCDYFKNKIRESTELIIDNVDDVSTSAIEDVINYIYTGKIDLKHVGEILKFVKHIGFLHLEELIMKYLIRNFSEIIQKEFFVDIPIDFLTTLINSEKLYVEQEKIFDGICMWISKDFDNRKVYLHHLLKSLNLHDFSEEFLFTRVGPLCQRHSIDVLQLFVDSITWIRQPALRANITFSSTRNRRKETLIIIDHKDPSNFDILDDEVYMWRSIGVNMTHKSISLSDVFDGKIYMCTDVKPEVLKSPFVMYLPHVVAVFQRIVIEFKNELVLHSPYDHECYRVGDKSPLYHGVEFLFSNRGYIEKWNDTKEKCLEFLKNTTDFNIDLCVMYDSRIMMFGTDESSNIEGSMKLKIYDFVTQSILSDHLMKKRTGFLTALIDEFLYIIGGSINGNNTNTVERLNLMSGEWTYMEELPRCYKITGAVTFNGKIICVGKDPNCILEYDPDENEWRELPLPISRKLTDPRIFLIPSNCLPTNRR